MSNIDFDLNAINKIIKKTINEIGSSREQIFQIVDNIRNEYESLQMELVIIKHDIDQIITEVDELEKQDKFMRQRLAEVSKKFDMYTEDDIKTAYQNAENTRIKLIIQKNKEKELNKRRSIIELTLKKSLQNVENAEKVMGQISIALVYLEGDILTALEDADAHSEMFLGIKILEAQENERKRIARDVHDGPAQHMANAVMKADICRMVIEKDFAEGLKELADLKQSVKKALKEVRDIIFDLRPMSLDDLGLNETIQETVKTIMYESEIELSMKLKPVRKEIEPIIQVAVYRIVQEVFNNIKKHANASYAEIKLDYGTKYLILVISDDGIGFDVDEAIKNANNKGLSYGLIGIMDRVNQLKGSIKMKSAAGKGTTYTIKLPVNREVISDEKKGD